jgi:hypothetical protein
MIQIKNADKKGEGQVLHYYEVEGKTLKYGHFMGSIPLLLHRVQFTARKHGHFMGKHLHDHTNTDILWAKNEV